MQNFATQNVIKLLFVNVYMISVPFIWCLPLSKWHSITIADWFLVVHRRSPTETITWASFCLGRGCSYLGVVIVPHPEGTDSSHGRPGCWWRSLTSTTVMGNGRSPQWGWSSHGGERRNTNKIAFSKLLKTPCKFWLSHMLFSVKQHMAAFAFDPQT